MELQFGQFHVKDAVFGEKTAYKDGILTINKQEAIDLILKDERITKIDIEIVKPGDSVRLMPVKSIIEPRCKVTEGNFFPGYHDSLKACGEGVTHCLKDMTVMVVGKYGNFEDGVIDMAGKGADYSMFSKMINVVVVMESTDEYEERYGSDAHPNEFAHRNASLVLAKYLGETVRNEKPDEYEVYKYDPILKPSKELEGLPKVALIFVSETNGGTILHQHLYGWPLGNSLPMLISPTVLIDGGITCNQMHVSGMGCYEYNYQNHPIIRSLNREHGKTLNFVGVIMPNDNADLTCKSRNFIMTVQLCKMLGIDGTIVNMPGYGNTYLDLLQIPIDLQKEGIPSVALGLECSGRDGTGNPFTLMNPDADKIVVTGNISEVESFPALDRVIGDPLCIVRDPSSGSWKEDEIYGPSLTEDGTVTCECNYLAGSCCSLGESLFTVKEF